MEFIELARSRRSVRSFSSKDVSHEDITKLLKAAQAAPSAGNCQPWHFYVIRERATRTDIADKASRQSFWQKAPVMIIVCADASRNEHRYGERGKNLYCIQDTAAAIQNILLCAKFLGLGACWCGAFDEDAVTGILRLPQNLRPVAIIPIGYPAGIPPLPVGRRPLNEIATFIGDANADGDLTEEETTRSVERRDMGGTVFNDVNLENSVFRDINFRNVDITDANLTGSKIHGCNLTDLAIDDCKLDGMTINGRDIGALLENTR